MQAGGEIAKGADTGAQLAETQEQLDRAAQVYQTATAGNEILSNINTYVTPWAQLAETYIRNDGKLTPSDWANAAGSTLASALVAGALSRYDKDAAESYIENAIGQEVGQFIGDSIGGYLKANFFPDPKQPPQTRVFDPTKNAYVDKQTGDLIRLPSRDALIYQANGSGQMVDQYGNPAPMEAKAVRDAVTLYFRRGQFAEGTRLLEEKGPSLPQAVRLECLGNMHFYRRELQEAIRCYEAAIAIAPDDIISRYQYLVGTQEEREGHVVDAFKRYQAAIEAEPTFVDSYVELGGLLVKIEDFGGAAQCYRDAVRLDPSDVANHSNLKAVLARLAQLEPARYGEELAKAEAAYEKAVKQRGASKQLSKHKW